MKYGLWSNEPYIRTNLKFQKTGSHFRDPCFSFLYNVKCKCVSWFLIFLFFSCFLINLLPLWIIMLKFSLFSGQYLCWLILISHRDGLENLNMCKIFLVFHICDELSFRHTEVLPPPKKKLHIFLYWAIRVAVKLQLVQLNVLFTNWMSLNGVTQNYRFKIQFAMRQ